MKIRIISTKKRVKITLFSHYSTKFRNYFLNISLAFASSTSVSVKT